MNEQRKMIDAFLFGAPPSREVRADESWDYLSVKHPDVTGDYYRGSVRVCKDHITIRQGSYEWIPNEKAIGELRALMAKWKERGWDNFVASVEIHDSPNDDEFEPDTHEVYESLGHSKTVRTYIKVPLANVRFFKELPRNGLSELISEPRTNARITGLSLSSDI